jgi:ribosome-associated translation inhibitor RaiA
MRVNIRAEAFDLTPGLRGLVESRLLGALASFSAHIQSVAAHLRLRVGRHQPDMTTCDIVVGLHPSGEVSVRTEDALMQRAVDQAVRAIRTAVEREVLKPRPSRESPPVTRPTTANQLEIVLDDNRISQQQRRLLERPENYLRPVRVGEYWRPPGVEDVALPEELAEQRLEQRRSR